MSCPQTTTKSPFDLHRSTASPFNKLWSSLPLIVQPHRYSLAFRQHREQANWRHKVP